ncbi:hypothetical protein ACFRAE_05265 [Sphingobacterium sp. HJSM2_6]|uniref:hypothetical protein n=1 Tax=Sphingobacterium sp. HJSM2_6 TaxID=3366264 RepID=UPI003BECDACF
MKNNLLIGFGLGLIAPVLAYFLTKHTDLVTQLFPDKPTAFYILAAAVNVIGCWSCYKKGLDKLANGLILAAFLGMILLVLTKNISITL